MKFLAFADLHYQPGIFYKVDYNSLRQIQERAEKENCEFIIHAGDFCHGASEVTKDGPVSDFVKAYDEFHIPSYHCFGNHEADRTPFEEMLKYYKLETGYYFFDKSGYRFIVCDPNYYCLDGQYIHFSLGNQYPYYQYINHVPPKQVQWIKETIDNSPYPCILISHQSFERVDSDGVKNAREIRTIINEANAKKPHSVLMCINGHYHKDSIRILENVCYLNLNSASNDFIGEEHHLFPEELYKEARFLPNNLIYEDALSAVITLEGNTITIEGMKSSMFMGVTREMTEAPFYDPVGLTTVPEIQSAKITLG